MKPKQDTIQFILPQANPSQLAMLHRLISEEVIGSGWDGATWASDSYWQST